MKKIPTLFERIYENHKVVGITQNVTPGMEWVLKGEGVATLKVDGSCCAIINGKFYKRYDCKQGKKPPAGAIPCCEPDPVTGHWPHWVAVDFGKAENRWFVEAFENTGRNELTEGTYEAVGPHFQGNPYRLESDILLRHGAVQLDEFPRTFEGMRDYLKSNAIEGVVFWKDGEPQCKIKRSDFGFEWPVTEGGT
jgi:hypothetical protein